MRAIRESPLRTKTVRLVGAAIGRPLPQCDIPQADEQCSPLHGASATGLSALAMTGFWFDALHQFTSGRVKVKVVRPSRLVTEIFSPWLQTMVFTM